MARMEFSQNRFSSDIDMKLNLPQIIATLVACMLSVSCEETSSVGDWDSFGMQTPNHNNTNRTIQLPVLQKRACSKCNGTGKEPVVDSLFGPPSYTNCKRCNGAGYFSTY